jgi:hypothetical protein
MSEYKKRNEEGKFQIYKNMNTLLLLLSTTKLNEASYSFCNKVIGN